MARSIWKGAINFGMVSIPSKVYSATDEARVNLHQYHQQCGTRIQQPKWCSGCERFLEAGEIIKGYDTGERVVTLTEEDFSRLPLKSIKAIEVVEFIDPSQVDIRCYDTPYFIAAEKPGTKAYKLFLMAMEQTGLAAVCKFAYRERERLALIRPLNGVMLLQTLLYADQLRPHDEFKPSEIVQQELGATPGVAISDKEIKMAVALISSMKNESFNHQLFFDQYRWALEKLIESKLTGEALEAPELPEAEPGDLADQLLASLNAAGVEVPA